MGGSLSEGLRIVFAIVITCLIITFAVTAWNSSKEAGSSALKDTNKVVTMANESKYTTYDGEFVTGSEVINFIKQNEGGDVQIEVINGSGSAVYVCGEDLIAFSTTEEAELIKKAKTKTDPAYIHPNRMYYGTVVRDENTSAILKVIFDSTGNAGAGGEAGT